MGAATILWGEDSSKPSLRDIRTVSDVGDRKIMNMGIVPGKGTKACMSNSWGLTVIPTRAKVREIGTEVCIMGARVVVRTSEEWEEGKKGRTWLAEGYSS